MQVTCPNCEARYAVDPLAIGPAGRTVQCARCHERWFQTVERERPTPDLVIRPPTRGASLPAVIKPRPPTPWTRYVVAAAAIVLLVVATALFAFRDMIIAQLPDDVRASVRSTIGSLMPTLAPAPPAPAANAPAQRQPQAQLTIDVAASKVELIEGRYVVRGEIVNKGDAPGTTKNLKIVFKNQGNVLGDRGYPLVQGPIAPGSRVAFAQALDEPPEGTTDIVPEIE